MMSLDFPSSPQCHKSTGSYRRLLLFLHRIEPCHDQSDVDSCKLLLPTLSWAHSVADAFKYYIFQKGLGLDQELAHGDG